jgi:hypothetical protein
MVRMKTSRHMGLVVAAAACVLGSSSFAGAAEGVGAPSMSAEVALQRALDQPFNLVLEKVEISEAFRQIAATAKISLTVDSACYDCLPYGATTRVSADFRNSKLRDAIEQVLITLALQQTVSGSSVIIRPSAALLHLGRRAQLEELKLLQDLRSNDLPAVQGDAALDFTTAIRAALDRQNIVVSLEGNIAAPLQESALNEVRKQLPMSIFRALETYCDLTHQLWFGEIDPLSSTGGATIHVMTMREWIKRQLDRPIQVNFVNTPFDQVVAELSHLTGIRFVPEPGLYQAFPALNLSSVNSSVAQTLEALAGTTRIVYDIRDDSILLHVAGGESSAQNAATQNAPSKPDNIIGHMEVPAETSGVTTDIFIRESDLPPELNELRKKKIEEAVASLEKSWNEPAATQPAATTKP